MSMLKKLLATAVAALTLSAIPVQAQNITAPPAPVPANITVDTVTVRGASLEGNLEGNSPVREALVILPPSYGTEPDRRYPVVYYLHGFAIDGRNFFNFMRVPNAVANSAARGAEFIVVVPDTLTRMGGSMYSTSVTTGDFRKFIAKDLVAFIDANYRTIPTRKGRGLAGHSMGGYGTLAIGMKYPEVFAGIYAQNACCITPRTETLDSARALSTLPIEQGIAADFGTRAGLASIVAWSPAPDKPPYYADFPYKDGAIDPLVIAQWAANSPLAMVAQHLDALKSFRAIGIDIGDEDFLLADNVAMHEALTRFGVAHEWEIYPGDHVNRIGQRFDEVVLPFFARHLSSGQGD